MLASLAASPEHGYAITQDVAETMGVRLSAGTLYAVIARLEARGLIEPLEEHDDRRRPYRITMAGAQALAQRSERMSKVASVARERLSAGLGWATACSATDLARLHATQWGRCSGPDRARPLPAVLAGPLRERGPGAPRRLRRRRGRRGQRRLAAGRPGLDLPAPCTTAPPGCGPAWPRRSWPGPC